MRRLAFALACTALLAITLPAAAQTLPAPAWSQVRGDDFCASQASPGGTETGVTLFQRQDHGPELRLNAAPWTDAVDGKIILLLTVARADKPQKFTANARRDPSGHGTAIDLAGINPRFLGGTLAVRTAKGRAIGTVQTLGIFRAAEWLERCTRERSRIDPGSGEPLVTPPRVLANPITSIDYPAAALRAEMQGRTVLALTVSAKGQVSQCEIAQSSGYALLDETGCNVVSRRTAFVPATDAQGRATQAMVKMPIVWKIPDDSPIDPLPQPIRQQ